MVPHSMSRHHPVLSFSPTFRWEVKPFRPVLVGRWVEEGTPPLHPVQVEELAKEKGLGVSSTFDPGMKPFQPTSTIM